MVKATRKCSIDDCSKAVLSREMCTMHYQRWWKHGDPRKTIRTRAKSLSLEEKFLTNIEWHGSCLIWVGTKDQEGYGHVHAEGKSIPAHRYAWERINEPIPAGMKIDHKFHCNVACCNVDHLRLATNAENMANRPGAQANSTSGVRNVYWHKASKRWVVQVKKHGKLRSYGRYTDIDEAAERAAEVRRELFGEFAGRG